MRKVWTAWIAVFLLAALPAAADTYELDLAHSTIEFKIRHLGLSKVTGRFHEFDGTAQFHPDAMAKSNASFTIGAASVDTRNEKRDGHLRSADFFDVEKYPEIVFTGKGVRETEDGWILAGTLDMHGVKKEIVLPFTVVGPMEDPWGGTRAGFEAEIEIQREDWGVGWENIKFRPPLIGNDVEIEISLQMIRQD